VVAFGYDTDVRVILLALLLLAYGANFLRSSLSFELLVYDDHPGQFVRLWQGMESLRQGTWTAQWHPEWFAGYPELQFYPPGFVIIGLLIHGITAAQLNLETVYQLLLCVIYLLPGITTFFLVSALTRSPWVALPPAFVALTLSAGLPSGVEEGLRWGMIGARLGLGLLPLLILSLLPWVRAGRWPIWSPLLLAAILLAHPYQFVTAFLLVLLAGVVLAWSSAEWRRAAAQTVAVIGLGVGLTAFWLFPLLFRASDTLPMAWSHGEWLNAFSRPILIPVLIFYALGVMATFAQRDELQRLRLVIVALPVALLIVAGADQWIIIERLGVLTLDTDRLRDGVVYGSLWAGGLGWAWMVSRIFRNRAPLASLAAVALLAVTPQNHRDPDLTLWPSRQPWPTLRQVETRFQIPVLREALQSAPPGRILFSASGIRLEEGDEWYLPHSHLFAMIPIQTGREIINGTFTHPSPIAGLVYTGSARPKGILQLVEELDGRQLFGQTSAQLDPGRLKHILTQLKVSTLVVPNSDSQLIARLEESNLFKQAVVAGAFRLFYLSEPVNTPIWRDRRTLQFRVPASTGEWAGTGLFAYPLWSATDQNGVLAVRESPERLLEVFVPPGKNVIVTLRYREGAVEWAGLGLTILSLTVWLTVTLHQRRRAC